VLAPPAAERAIQVGEVALTGADYVIAAGRAGHAGQGAHRASDEHEPLPRWIPVAVIGGALAIAVAVAVAIGIT